MTWLQDNSPNWTAIGVTVGGVITAIGVPIGAYNVWFKQRVESKRDATSLTLDAVFKLVDQLQDEVKVKAEQLKEADTLTRAKIDSYEAQKVVYEKTIATQLEVIQTQAEEVRKLRLGIG